MKQILLGLLLLLGIAPLTASADEAYTVARVNLRAGPDNAYPTIGTLPAGASVDIFGCIEDWSWCDVAWGGERGWIYGDLLEYDYEDQRYGIYDYGPELGLPILSFVFGSYWDDHYRGRSWYNDRNRWSQHRPVYRPRPAQSSRRIQSGRSTSRSVGQPARSATRSTAQPARSTPRSTGQSARPATRSTAQPARSTSRSTGQPGRSASKPAAGRAPSSDKQSGNRDGDDDRPSGGGRRGD